jgi:hypothetical protein
MGSDRGRLLPVQAQAAIARKKGAAMIAIDSVRSSAQLFNNISNHDTRKEEQKHSANPDLARPRSSSRYPLFLLSAHNRPRYKSSR